MLYLFIFTSLRRVDVTFDKGYIQATAAILSIRLPSDFKIFYNKFASEAS